MSIEELPGFVPGFRQGLNRRELGGWHGADNSMMRHVTIYRSGQLHGFEPSEREALSSLGIRSVVDLRSSAEALSHPDPQLAGMRMMHVNANYATREAYLERKCGADADGIAPLRQRYPEPRSRFALDRIWHKS